MTARPLHWREYLLEALELACFMMSALAVTALVQHPSSPLRHALPDALLRRALTGVAMGLTAAAIIYSPWGRRSGAHFNPSVTLTFLRLGKITPRDAALYILAQFAGGIAGVASMTVLLQSLVADPSVNYVATVPGTPGAAIAFIAELAISFGMMTVILQVSNSTRYSRLTGVAGACLVAIYITVEAPLSGMSMNPARSLAPALAAGRIDPLWIYFIAPPIGMLLAAELYVRRYGRGLVRCAKLHHPAGGPCHFHCHKESTT
jgi:aquaporin Z